MPKLQSANTAWNTAKTDREAEKEHGLAGNADIGLRAGHRVGGLSGVKVCRPIRHGSWYRRRHGGNAGRNRDPDICIFTCRALAAVSHVRLF